MSDLQKIEPEVTEVINRMPNFPIITKQEEAGVVSNYLNDVVALRKRITEFFRPDIDKAHELHKSLLAKMKQVDSAPAQVESKFRSMISDWLRRERERVAAKQRQLDEEARKKALAEAKKEGDAKTAKAIETGKIAVVSERAPEPVAKVEGVTTREYFSAEVIDLMALVKAVAAGKAPLEYLTANQSGLNGVMRATKGQAVIPGVRAKREDGIMKR
jgi:hypothetical protein